LDARCTTLGKAERSDPSRRAAKPLASFLKFLVSCRKSHTDIFYPHPGSGVLHSLGQALCTVGDRRPAQSDRDRDRRPAQSGVCVLHSRTQELCTVECQARSFSCSPPSQHTPAEHFAGSALIFDWGLGLIPDCPVRIFKFTEWSAAFIYPLVHDDHTVV
jgi:hypothetical protein